jgi:hypothetical protein
MNPKHQKETTYTKQTDGSIKIESKSYYEQLAQELIEIEKHVPTSFYTLKKDVEGSLSHLTDDKASQLIITIKVINGEPRLTKRYVTLKRNYPKQ